MFDRKNELKIIEFSSSFKLNEIHKVNSPFNEDPKNIVFSREGRPENSGKMGNNSYICCYANRGVVNFEREYQPPPAGTKILVIPQFSCMPDQILGKNGKTLFSGQNLTFLQGSPLLKYKEVFKHFLYEQTSLVID